MEEVFTGAAHRSTVVIIDQNKLRRACLVNFLQAWADSMAASLIGMGLAATLQDLQIGSECRLVVLNLGRSSIDSPDAQCLLGTLKAETPHVPVVLFSDLEEPDEVVTAFRAGIKAFIPASIESDIVPQALTFVIGGGCFFPPSILLDLQRESDPGSGDDTAGNEREHLGAELNPADGDLREGRPRQLTLRQMDVLTLLRHGKSNKAIARELGMREATVKVHIRQILRKMGASNRTQAALCMTGAASD